MKLNQITRKDWIPSPDVYQIYKDSKGFIWIVSREHGLYRYDGYSFTEYRYERQHSDTSVFVFAEAINCIIEDKNGILWIGGTNGLYQLNLKESEKIAGRYPLDDYEDKKNLVWSIYEDNEENLWLGANLKNVIPVFDKKKKEFFYITLQPETGDSLEYQNFWIDPAFLDNDNNMWFCSNQGLYMYNQEEKKFYNYHPNPDLISDFANIITSICEENPDVLWVGTMKGLFSFDKKMKNFTLKFPILAYKSERGATETFAIKKDKWGNIWFRTKNGLYRFRTSEKVTSIKKEFSYQVKNIWSNRSLEFDDNGNIWFGVNGQGINILVPERKYLRALVHDENDPGTISQGACCVIEDKKGNLWIGYFGNGLDKYSIETNKITHYMHNPLDPQSISSNRIICLFQDHTGILWAGSEDFGLNKIFLTHDKKIRVKRYLTDPDNPGSISDNSINRIFEDNKNNLWVFTKDSCLNRYDREHDAFFLLRLRTPDVINNRNYKAEEFKDEIWFNHWHWIDRIIPPFTNGPANTIKASKIIRYQISPDNPKSVAANRLYMSTCLSTVYQPGTFWFGTHYGLGNMMRIKDEKNNQHSIQIKIFTNKYGFNGNIVNGILEDSHGNIWITTDKAFLKFDPRSELFTDYSILDVFPSGTFLGRYPYKDKNGTMYFTHRQGILIFNPDSIRQNIKIPPIYITGFTLFDERVSVGKNSPLIKPITYTKEIELSYKQNYFAFEFVVLDYTDPEHNYYRYKLEGFDKDWINSGSRRIANYTNLPSGSYIFKVMGSNSEGIWNTEGASLKIIIHPPPWKTVWAYIIYGFILIGIILWYRRFLLNRAKIRTELEVERVEKEKVQELDHMKSRFFANISHEFRTPLTLLLGPIEDLLKSKPERDEKERGIFKIMQRNARRLQLLINQLLDLSKLETGKVKLQVSEGDISEFIRAIVLSFLSLAESKKIDYQYDIPVRFGLVYYDADKIEKILTNLISNAFKFTPANGKVGVSFQYVTSAESGDPQYAEIRVSDTGKGIPEEQLEKIFDRFYQVSDSDKRDAEGTGIGLALTKELVDLYHGEISVESEVGKGSTFRVRLPVSREQFKEEEIVTMTPSDEVIKKPVESELEQTETELGEIKEGQNLGKIKDTPVILIVEDNIDLSNYISKNLGDSYQILAAENGKKGLELAIENIPDLVISDLMMPVMDGIEMCRQLKEDERTNHIPVVMLTAKADRGSKMEGLETGADDYIIKPFDADELRVRVRNLIEQRRRLREKFRKELISESLENPPVLKDQFLGKLMENLNKNMSDPDFTIKKLGNELYMSWSQLYRKVAAVTGMTPNELLQMIRMKHAAQLLLSREFNIAQVMYQVGMRNTSYFAQSFRKYYGKNPSEYRHTKKSM